MSLGCFAERLNRYVQLTPAECRVLDRLEERQRTLRRGAILVRENDRVSEVFLLKRGLMMSYLLLDGGSRQILNFLFSGDMIGMSSIVYSEAPETVAALADCTVCPIERSRMTGLIVEHPRLAALLMVYGQIERVTLTDRLAGVGRTSAKARVAALLLELRNRLRMEDRTIDATFVMPLTQEEIGDAIGLTSVHVNRMLRQLEDEALIARDNGLVTLLNERMLVRSANYVSRHEGLDLSWLPPSRE